MGMLQEWITVQTGVVRPEVRGVRLPDELMGDAMRFCGMPRGGALAGLAPQYDCFLDFFRQIPCVSKTFTDRMNTASSSIMDYARFKLCGTAGDLRLRRFSPHRSV